MKNAQLHASPCLLLHSLQGEAASTAEKKAAEGEIVYDSTTLRMSVKDKIKRLSQVKFEPPSSSVAQKKAASLPRDAKLPDSVPG